MISSDINAFILAKDHTVVMYVAKHLIGPATSRNTNAFILVTDSTIVMSVTKHLLSPATSSDINAFMSDFPQIFLD